MVVVLLATVSTVFFALETSLINAGKSCKTPDANVPCNVEPTKNYENFDIKSRDRVGLHTGVIYDDTTENLMKKFVLRRPTDAVKTGHEINVTLSNGRKTIRRTISMKPLLFEYDEFLTPEECDEIISLRNEKFKKIISNRSLSYDWNGDGWVTLVEMRHKLMTDFNSFMKDVDLKGMLQAFVPNIQIVEKHKVRAREMLETKFSEDSIVKGYLKKLAKLKPTIIGPNRQVTSFMPGTLSKKERLIRETVERAGAMLEIPIAIMNKTSVEVMYYIPNGAANVHMDSNIRNDKLPCCHMFMDRSRCVVCQWITLLTYLNKPEEGGETVYPVADHPEGENQVARVKELREDLPNLCKDGVSNIKVKPKKGKVLIMYNHFDGEDGEWFGPTDEYSYHGPCPVIKGEKYILLIRIPVTENREFDLTPLAELIRFHNLTT